MKERRSVKTWREEKVIKFFSVNRERICVTIQRKEREAGRYRSRQKIKTKTKNKTDI